MNIKTFNLILAKIFTMYQRHIDYIKEQKEAIGFSHQRLMSPFGKSWINENYQHQFLENIWEVSFKHMYANIMLQMAKNRIIELKNRYKIEEALSLSDKKLRNNILYGLLHKQNQMNFYLTKVYVEAIYDEILEDHFDKMIYIDTDVFFTKEVFDLEKYCQLEYDFEQIDLSYFYKKKQYFFQNENNSKFSGFTKSQIDSVKSEMTSKLREYKLSKII